ncbi:Androgen-induced gene 1 protein [Eumeta japonica]|uniref:Androgen-induced gene 1 protein n=1 Tax=Eumeta variegata TaxID=151549 RepID=A0A4C1W7V7_EUMVA|nr:Androgen-induced gene 1 protein [Eumeta japonica]
MKLCRSELAEIDILRSPPLDVGLRSTADDGLTPIVTSFSWRTPYDQSTFMESRSSPKNNAIPTVDVSCADTIIQTIYFGLATANDIIGTDEAFPEETPLIRSIRDIAFSAFAVPTAMYVTFVFWSIYAVNRELILPKKADGVIPSWLNHLMHTAVLFFIGIEMCVSPHDYPSRSVGTILVVSISFFYFLWKMYVYLDTKTWVYPLFDALNWPLRACYCFGTAALSVVLYCLGETLNSALWSSEMSKMKIV